MKIAIIVPSLANKGPISVAKDLVVELVNQGHGVTVFYFDNIVELNFSCETKRIDFFDSIKFNDYDIIHSHMLRPDAYVWWNRKKIKCPTITTKHNYTFSDLKHTYNWLIAILFTPITHFLMSRHSVIVALTQDMGNTYGNSWWVRSMVCIYNGRRLPSNETWQPISTDDNAKIKLLKENHILMGAFAGLTTRKGIHQLIDVLTINPYLSLLIIGDGKERFNLEKQAQKLGVYNRCLFLGYRKDAYRYLPFLDLFALPSYSEGFPLSLLEAGQMSLPVVCSNIPLFKEIFSEKEVAFFNLDNCQSLNTAIEHILSKADIFAKNLKDKIEADYSCSAMAKQYIQLYKSLREQ